MASTHPDELIIKRDQPNPEEPSKTTIVSRGNGEVIGCFEPHYTDIQLRRSWKYHIQALCNAQVVDPVDDDEDGASITPESSTESYTPAPLNGSEIIFEEEEVPF